MTSARGWLKMSGVDKNLRNSEMGEVWARVNKTIYGVGFGQVESRRKEQRQCVFPQWRSHSPHRAHHSCITSYTLIQWWFYPPSPPPCSLSPRHTLPTRKFVSPLRVGSGQPFTSAFPASCTIFARVRHPVNVGEGMRRLWLEQRSQRQRSKLGLDSFGWLKVSQSLTVLRQWRTMEAVWVEEQWDVFQRDFLVALGSLAGKRGLLLST